jgi:hypothetical protein
MTKVSFKIFCRGYDIKSWMAFQESVNAKYEWEETTRDAYEKYCLQPLEDNEGSTMAPPEKKSRNKKPEVKKTELPFSSLENFFSPAKKGPAKNPGKNKIEKKRV